MSSLAVLGALLSGSVSDASGQARPSVRWSAQAITAWTGADPVPGGGPLDEIRMVQPVAMVQAGWGPHVALQGTLDLEGLTMPHGELTLGAWGEGFVDRRHPHTYAHELLHG